MAYPFRQVRRSRARSTRSQHRFLSKNWLVVLVMIVLALVFLAPFFWLCMTALKSLPELAIYPIRWFPVQAQWDNFVKAVTMIDYLHYTSNTLVLATMYASLVTISSALVGFAFARLSAPGKNTLFIMMLATIMLPQTLTVIPTYVLFSRFGLIDTYWPWFLWGLASAPYLSFLFRQFFAGIPKELEDAAIIDGCSYGRIFWQIFLPLSLPVLVTAFVIAFTGTWGDWFAPKLFLSQDNTTLGVAMSTGYNDGHNDVLTNILAAGSILYVTPVLLIFFFAQRYYVRGIVTSGIK
ncbi:sugar ABC transporter permease [Dictyobacter alpinus]|uniref:Sugar ABC transporter permease n=1 Tax=Dictyobacter alpinus TaxID=2014873 RepID=A0A402BFB7_9CHLR|nr:carbohydrate ABC transporter permease [Dictyobacter alpinus]GCE30039.1 sugar ABC transporter permease [Dictyobacter alpinus]